MIHVIENVNEHVACQLMNEIDMSVDSFFTTISDETNLNRTGSIVGTKGRFKVIHIDETDEGIDFSGEKFL
jgi:hypothetical protein